MKFWYELDGALVRTSANLADDIRDGIRQSVNVADIARDVANSFPTNDDARRYTTAELREWTSRHIRTNKTGLMNALEKLYATGFVLGRDAAGAAYSHAVLNKAAPSSDDINNFFNIDWSSWTPGNRAAANLVKPRGALSRLLDSRGATISGVNKTTLDRIGTKLADTLNRGATDETLRDAISSVIDDPRRALTIATTEMARATSVASLDSYQEFGLEQVEWLALDPCEICADNEDAGPVNVGDEFPSGDTEPPAHPNCRCSLVPVVDGADGADVADTPIEDVPAGYADGELAAIDAATGLMESGADALAVDVHPDLEVATTEVAPPVAETPVRRGPIDAATLLNKVDEVAKQREVFKDLAQTSPVGELYGTNANLNAIQKIFNADGLPQVVNDVSELTGETLYRGVNIEPDIAAVARDNFLNAKSSWQGYGVYGDGTYFTTNELVARGYAGTFKDNYDNVYQAALKPDANVIRFSSGLELIKQTEAAYAEIEQEVENDFIARGLVPNSQEWDDAKQNFLDTYLGGGPTSNVATSAIWLIKGYDAYVLDFPPNSRGFRENYTIVINRGALQVVK